MKLNRPQGVIELLQKRINIAREGSGIITYQQWQETESYIIQLEHQLANLQKPIESGFDLPTDTPTPETDALIEKQTDNYPRELHSERLEEMRVHARTLERQRNAALAEKERLVVALKEGFEKVRTILKERTKGEFETWSFVAMFMEMIDEAEKQTRATLSSESPTLTLAEEVERLKGELSCDVCGGTGTPASDKPCGCNGTGKVSVLAQTLREELFDTQSGLTTEKSLREAAEKERDEWKARAIEHRKAASEAMNYDAL